MSYYGYSSYSYSSYSKYSYSSYSWGCKSYDSKYSYSSKYSYYDKCDWDSYKSDWWSKYCDKPDPEPEPSSISGKYFCDCEGDDIDNGDSGISGVTVTLMDVDGNVIATTTTDDDGEYSFDDLDAGDYVVKFDADPDGRAFVGQDVGGDDTVDSDVDSTGMTDVITLAEGQDLTDVDAGVAQTVESCDEIQDLFVPGEDVTIQVDDHIDGNAWTVTVSNSSGLSIDGVYAEAYCLEAYQDTSALPSLADAFLGTADDLAGLVLTGLNGVENNAVANINYINWIINQDFELMDNGEGGTYTQAEIQGAIWGFTDDIVFVGGPPENGTTANAQEIFDMALASPDAASFVPGAGDEFTLVFDPHPDEANEQAFIISLEFDDFCECDCSEDEPEPPKDDYGCYDWKDWGWKDWGDKYDSYGDKGDWFHW